MNSNRPDIIANDPAAREMNGPGWAPTAPRETGNRLLPAALAGRAGGTRRRARRLRVRRGGLQTDPGPAGHAEHDG